MPQCIDDDSFTNHILDLLAPWCAADARRMFSGIGIFANGRMFAIIFDGVLYLKDHGDAANAENEKEYFEYSRQGKTVRLGYFKAPGRALEDGAHLVELAKLSYQRAKLSNKKSRARTKSKSKGGPGLKLRGKPPPQVLKSPFL